MAISLSKTGNAIKFTFEDNAYYLSNGVIEVPLNSLTLVTDDSDMFTFKKSATNDVFISGRYSDIGMTKSELESYYKENMVGSTGGSGSGMTSGEVQTMIDESISGKADTSDVQNVASDVATVSGDVNTLSGDVSTLSGAVDSNHNAITAVVGDVQTLSGQVQGDKAILTGHTANTDIHVTASDKQNWNNKSDFSGSYNDLTDKPTIPVVPTNVSAFNNDAGYATSGYVNSAVSGKMDTSSFNNYSASTDARLSEDEEVTSAALNALSDALDDKADATAVTASIAAAVSGKQDTLVSGTNIKTINNESLLGSGNINIQTGSSINVVQATGTSSADVMSQSAVSQSLNNKYDRLSLAVVQDEHLQLDGRTDLYATKGLLTDLIFEASSINGKQVLNQSGSTSNKFDLVETSAITSSVTSASTDSQVPSAKAVYDALQEGGGGVPESAFTTYTASTDARLSEDEEVTAAGLNALNDALSGKQDTLSAGTNITISGNVISAEGGGKAIEAGRGIAITTGATADTVSFNLPISAGTGNNSLVMGEKAIASGAWSFSNGNGNILKPNTASGERSIAIGYACEANGKDSMAIGQYCSISNNANYAKALGSYINALNTYETSLGNCNISNKNNTNTGDTLFSVGNGNGDNKRHNAIEIRRNGDVYIPNTDDTTSANYYEKPMYRLQDLIVALGGLKLVQISQSDYDNLQNKDASTLYLITGSN